MRSMISRILIFALLAGILLTGCDLGQPVLNGVALREFTIVYSQDAPDYCQRAAEYIQAQVLSITGIELPVRLAEEGENAHEIVVGQTDRAISQALDAQTEHVEFAILADENHIALEGDYFIIAAAAYYFVDSYITGKLFKSTVAQEVSVHEPITEEATHFLFLIGDGMGFNHTKLFDTMPIPEDVPYYDNETLFYGEYLPYQGSVLTGSLSGITDSAAAATALACGYKTFNSYVGMDQNQQPVQSLTELADSLEMGTAVLSTDLMTGATPAGFSAHAKNRDDSKDILACQAELLQKNTIINCSLNATEEYQDIILDTLETVDANPNGFFLMYEEGHIDKFSHNNNLQDTFASVIRFNQAIGVFMEYAFYHPDTFLLITADHETGGLKMDDNGNYVYQTESHTGSDVPIYAYGQGAEVFNGFTGENVELPKVIARLWGVETFGME